MSNKVLVETHVAHGPGGGDRYVSYVSIIVDDKKHHIDTCITNTHSSSLQSNIDKALKDIDKSASKSKRSVFIMSAVVTNIVWVSICYFSPYIKSLF
jgi:hypothetical protein